MRRLFRNGRYANVTSTLALVVALGGTGAYAASTIRSKDIRNGQVKNVDLAHNAVTSAKVKNHTLKATDFSAGQLSTNAYVLYSATAILPPNGQIVVQKVLCKPGDRTVGGGAMGRAEVQRGDGPETTYVKGVNVPTGWIGTAANFSDSSADYRVYAICAD